MTGAQGGVVDKTMPIHISNVAIFNPTTGKADRVGIKEVDGHKVRVYRSNGEVVGVKA
jgi:large subunit ribosomal protein L24